MTPIAAYLDELGGLLRRGARRRIIAEVRAHLLDAAAAVADEEPESAQRRAVARFGSPPEVAHAFNSVRRRRRTFPRRAAAVVLASAATASVGTATVWALAPGAVRHAHAAAHSRHGAVRHVVRDRRPAP